MGNPKFGPKPPWNPENVTKLLPVWKLLADPCIYWWARSLALCLQCPLVPYIMCAKLQTAKAPSEPSLFTHMISTCTYLTWAGSNAEAGPARSFGCTVRLVFRRSRVRSSGPGPSFIEIWSQNNFYSHFLPTADLSRAVVSYWQTYMYGHLVLVNCLGSLPRNRNSVDRLTDYVRNDLNSVEEL